jgi:hypothetical protein
MPRRELHDLGKDELAGMHGQLHGKAAKNARPVQIVNTLTCHEGRANPRFPANTY